MADYLVTDTDLTSIADAIRAKGGTSAQLAFPQGFAAAVEAIETGGGVSWVDYAEGHAPTGRIELPDIQRSNAMYTFNLPGYTYTIFSHNTYGVASNFRSAKGCEVMVFPDMTDAAATGYTFSENYAITTADFAKIGNLPTNAFYSCAAFSRLILRKSAIVTLANTNAIANGTRFKNGGTGGEVYIPKSLYDHLGDGSDLDYQAATNWATIQGYGTITWAQIEGSIYETQYADGTPIT